jgi:Leucine-rich repeat (LRR) protein
VVRLNGGQSESIVFADEPRQLDLRVKIFVFVFVHDEWLIEACLILQINDFAFASSIDLTICTWLHHLNINCCDMLSLPPSICLLTDLVELGIRFNPLTSVDELDFVRMSKLTALWVSSAVCVIF